MARAIEPDADESRLAPAEGARLAQATGASLRVVTVLDPEGFGWPGFTLDRPGDRTMLEEARERAHKSLHDALEEIARPDSVTAEVIESDPVDVLVRESGGLDLLVRGSRGYGLVRQVLLGGVAGKLVDEAACPVLVYPRVAVDREPAAVG